MIEKSKIINCTMGERIAYLRKDKELSRKQLAEMLDMSQVTISNYENDKRVPDIKTLADLSAIFGVSMNVLMRGCEPDKSTESILDD